ncbi:MAG: PAS domain S-box protein, partial [Thermodesulfobacteriota bacterium]|nr:PAS domain S-box protein [Thermodesulfobacteriota bacterium]
MLVISWNNLPKKIPLLIVLVTSFVTLNVLAVGLVGYLSFRNGQRAVNDVAYQLRNQITTRIEEHLYTFLNIPHQINQTNANILRRGVLAVNDAPALERHFWEQIQIFDSVSSIYFGNTEGGLANAGREGAEGLLYVISTDGFVSGPFKKYATDSQGQRADLLVTVPDFDARTRPWYIGAVSKDNAAWSEAYILFTGQDMAIAASRPVYNEQQDLLGVVSVDLFLSHLSGFLQSLEIGKTGQGFIMERSGLLVASSSEEKLFTEPGENEAQRRLYANESANPLIRHAAEALSAQFGDYRHIAETQQLEFEIDGKRQFLQVSPIKNKDGLDWFVVVVIPEADFMAQINANNHVTTFFIFFTLVITVVVGVVVSRKIIGPILRLNTFAYALSKGEWGQTVSHDSRISEISSLTRSLNHMAGQLQQMFKELNREVAGHKRAEEALRESELKYRSLVESSSDAILMMDNERKIVSYNKAFLDLFGYGRDEIKGKSIRIIHPSDASFRSFGEAAYPVIERQGFYRTECEFIHKNGSILPTENVTSAIKESGGSIRGYVSVIRNTTEKKRLEDQLRQSQKMESIGTLAGGIAHDFNNVLYAIIGYTELSMDAVPEGSKARRNLNEVLKAADRATDMVQQILTFSRKSEKEKKPTSVQSVLKEAVKLIRTSLPSTIEIRQDIAADCGPVMADPTQIHEVIMNLGTNAYHAMREKGGILGITL